MQKNDYLWKGVLEDIFDDFLRFMHPEADLIFDFKRGITFLDKELEQLFPSEVEDEFSVKIVDKLAKLYTCEGNEEWVLVHCEVQGEYNSDFPHRMFTYFYRILDKYGKRISAYAILTEKTQKARVESYVNEYLGTKLEYHYNVYKISQQSESDLLQSNNPFAMVVLTVRSILKNKRLDDASLMEIKLALARRFLTMSLPKEKIRLIMNFLKSYIHFENTENNITFDREIQQITGNTKTMGLEELILTTERKRAEKRGMEQGMECGIKQGVEHGMERNKREVVLRMIQKDFADEMIADIAGVSLEYVREVRYMN